MTALNLATPWRDLTGEARRVAALDAARELLTVKAGRYAERDIDPAFMIELADYILGDPLYVLDWPGEPLTREQSALIRKVLKRDDREGVS